MSKQDGYAPRTAADLERKYNFGKTFAEVYGLVGAAQKAADEAQAAFDGLNQEQIFNLLTNYGQAQGVYRDENGDVYVNASYIKSGKLAAEYIETENLKVSAANITGELVATQINAKDLKVAAANITGTLTAGQIDATNLKVSAANITGTLTASKISGGTLDFDQVTAKNLNVTLGQISDLSSLSISADQINAGTLNGITIISQSGIKKVEISNGTIAFGSVGDISYTSAGLAFQAYTDMYLGALKGGYGVTIYSCGTAWLLTETGWTRVM